MLEPVISVNRALFLTFVGFFSFWLAYLLLKRRKDSRYPNLYASLMCIGAGLWILVSVFVDRVTQKGLYLLSAKLTYVIPFIALFFFYLFAKNFPIKTKSKIATFLSFTAFLTALSLSTIVLLPNNIVINLHVGQSQIIAIYNRPIYFIVMAGYVYLLGLIINEVYVKWPLLKPLDKRIIKLIVLGIVLAFIPAVTFSVYNALYVPDSSFYQYAYPPIIIFIYFFAYVVLKYGALDAGITFSKKAILGTAVVLIMFSALFFLL